MGVSKDSGSVKSLQMRNAFNRNPFNSNQVQDPANFNNTCLENVAKVQESNGQIVDQNDPRDTGATLPIGWRSVIAFWLLGLCNNYGYVVMLSAAVDIINSNSPASNSSNLDSAQTSDEQSRNCNEMSTGAILLADVVPSLFVKLLAPFFPIAMHFRMSAVILLNVIGFVCVSQATHIYTALSGVVAIAFASGLGEASLLAYMAFFKNRGTVSAWSSGTGGAGIFGAGSYMLLAYLSGSNRSQPLLIFLIVPALMAISFWVLLERPVLTTLPQLHYEDNAVDICQAVESNAVIHGSTEQLKPLLMDKIRLLPGLMKYMLPFGLVYLSEYFINQGIHELIQFEPLWMSVANQYVSYQLMYQLGVFISRSSINFFRLRKLWILATLQVVNVVLFTSDAIYGYIDSIYIIWALIVYEGMIGGLTYVNTYDRINREVPIEKREFSMGMNSLADAAGISLAGFLAIPAHNYICSLPK